MKTLCLSWGLTTLHSNFGQPWVTSQWDDAKQNEHTACKTFVPAWGNNGTTPLSCAIINFSSVRCGSHSAGYIYVFTPKYNGEGVIGYGGYTAFLFRKRYASKGPGTAVSPTPNPCDPAATSQPTKARALAAFLALSRNQLARNMDVIRSINSRRLVVIGCIESWDYTKPAMPRHDGSSKHMSICGSSFLFCLSLSASTLQDQTGTSRSPASTTADQTPPVTTNRRSLVRSGGVGRKGARP